MNLKGALCAFLQANAGVASRVHPLILPQKPTYPAITYQVISDVAERNLGGVARRRARVQLSCWGRSYAEATQVAGKVSADLQDFQGVMGGAGGPYIMDCNALDQSDQHEPQVGIYRVPVDALILYRGGDPPNG
ncbi:MAG TPA: DUF3168 domain-containing protein [Symbiobacteriaceae bacterium]|nr:DUF3168 domain-containing protein [Symbiobacteriaceae bacterium]